MKNYQNNKSTQGAKTRLPLKSLSVCKYINAHLMTVKHIAIAAILKYFTQLIQTTVWFYSFSSLGVFFYTHSCSITKAVFSIKMGLDPADASSFSQMAYDCSYTVD